MSIVRASTETISAATATGGTLTIPTGTVAGDYLLVIVTSVSSSRTLTVTMDGVSVPEELTAFSGSAFQVFIHGVEVTSEMLNASVDGVIAYTISGSAVWQAAQAITFTSVVTADFVTAGGKGSQADSTTHNTGGLTTTTNDTMLLIIGADRYSPGSGVHPSQTAWYAPAGFDSIRFTRQSTTKTTAVSLVTFIDDTRINSSTAVTAKTVTTDLSYGGASWLVAVRAGAPLTLTTTTERTTTIDLTGTAGTPPFTYALTQDSGPTVTINEDTDGVFWFVNPDPWTTNVVLTAGVTDDAGSISGTVTVTPAESAGVANNPLCWDGASWV